MSACGFFVLLTALATSTSLVPLKCPLSVVPLTTLSLELFAGNWYELMDIPSSKSAQNECVQETFLYNSSKPSNLVVKTAAVDSSSKFFSMGAINRIDATKSPRRLLLTYSDDATLYEMSVIATDYVNYAVTLICEDFNGTASKAGPLFKGTVTTRIEGLSFPAMEAMKKELSSRGVDFDLFQVKRLEGCNFN